MPQRNFASSLVIVDYPLQLLPKLAKAIGLNQALFVQQLHYWLNCTQHFYDESYWIYNTLEEWQEQFPFWSLSTIKRVIKTLKKIGLVHCTEKYNTANTDRKLWYTLDYNRLSQIEELQENLPLVQSEPVDQVNMTSPSGQFEPMDQVNMTSPSGQFEPMDQVNMNCSLYRTETTTETTNRDYAETTTTTDPRDRAPQADPEEVVVVVSHPPEVVQLIEIGLPEPKAMEFFNSRGPAYIQEKIEILHSQPEVRYPSRWLLSALEKDFQPENYIRPDPAEQERQDFAQQMAAEQQAYQAQEAARLAKAQQAEVQRFQALHSQHGVSQYHFDCWKKGLGYCKKFVLNGNQLLTQAMESTALLAFSDNHARIGVLDGAMMFQLQHRGKQFLQEAIAYAMRDELQRAKITYELKQL